MRKKNPSTVIVYGCVALMALLGACTSMQQTPSSGTSGVSGTSGATGSSPRTNAGLNLSGYPPAFKDGFSDGCESLRGNYRRDGRFGKDNDYTLGWQDGYSICGRQKR